MISITVTLDVLGCPFSGTAEPCARNKTNSGALFKTSITTYDEVNTFHN